MAPTEDDEATEARTRFEDAYELLRTGFNLTDGRDHDEMSYLELVAEHETMESLRGDAFMARRGIVSRVHPPAPDHVETPVGVQDTSWTGRVFAVVGAFMFLGIFALTWWLVVRERADVALRFGSESVVEIVGSDGDLGCEWQLDVEVVNGTDTSLEVDRSYVILERRRTTARPIGEDGRAVVEVGRARLLFGILVPRTSIGACPLPGSLDHGDLYVEFEADRRPGSIDRSVRF